MFTPLRLNRKKNYSCDSPLKNSIATPWCVKSAAIFVGRSFSIKLRIKARDQLILVCSVRKPGTAPRWHHIRSSEPAIVPTKNNFDPGLTQNS